MSTISWVPSSEACFDTVPPPAPAKNYVPDWYSSLCPVTANTFDYDFENNIQKTSVRNCMPFYDALTAGYVQETWCDIFVECDHQGNFKYTFSAPPDDVPPPMGLRPVASVTSFTHTYPIEFVWHQHWRPKTPKGWSSLVCHPLNRHDLPFVTTAGIIDSDVFYHSPAGQAPFYVKDGFSGIIPAGTPMYQIIPFKRDNWKSVAEKFDSKEEAVRRAKIKRHLVSSYARQFWQKKRYQ